MGEEWSGRASEVNDALLQVLLAERWLQQLYETAAAHQPYLQSHEDEMASLGLGLFETAWGHYRTLVSLGPEAIAVMLHESHSDDKRIAFFKATAWMATFWAGALGEPWTDVEVFYRACSEHVSEEVAEDYRIGYEQALSKRIALELGAFDLMEP